jgi:PIN domain nuclease of toxin-antitoxin system
MGGIERLRLLLDTHIILWSAAEPEKLPSNIAEELDNDFNELWFSPISVWEILLLAEKGRVSLGPDNIKSVRDIFRTIPLKEAPLNLEVAVQSRSVNLPHQDPADRFLAATAVVYDLTLVTADSRIIHAESVAVLPAL